MQFTFTIGDLAILVAALGFIIGMGHSIGQLKQEVKRLTNTLNEIWKNHIQPLNNLVIQHGKRLDEIEVKVNSLMPKTLNSYLSDVEQKAKDAELEKKIRSGELRK